MSKEPMPYELRFAIILFVGCLAAMAFCALNDYTWLEPVFEVCVEEETTSWTEHTITYKHTFNESLHSLCVYVDFLPDECKPINGEFATINGHDVFRASVACSMSEEKDGEETLVDDCFYIEPQIKTIEHVDVTCIKSFIMTETEYYIYNQTQEEK